MEQWKKSNKVSVIFHLQSVVFLSKRVSKTQAISQTEHRVNQVRGHFGFALVLPLRRRMNPNFLHPRMFQPKAPSLDQEGHINTGRELGTTRSIPHQGSFWVHPRSSPKTRNEPKFQISPFVLGIFGSTSSSCRQINSCYTKFRLLGFSSDIPLGPKTGLLGSPSS